MPCMRRLGIVAGVAVAVLTTAGLLAPPTAQASAGPQAARPVAVPAHPAFAARVPASTTQVVRTIPSHRWCKQVWCTVTQAWEKQGGEWRLLSVGPPVQVGLFTCDGGEEMGRIESTESPFVAYVEARSKQHDCSES